MALVGSVRRIVAALMVLMMMSVAARAQEINDYPTSARVEYVFGCLKANGETRQAIEQCSCSVDVVASHSGTPPPAGFFQTFAARCPLSDTAARSSSNPRPECVKTTG